jgi:SAM-dependent methyltransferase
MEYRVNEYAKRGDYHKSLDVNWPYYPIYLAKLDFVNKYISEFPKEKNILDLGCGEGVLVEQFRKKEYNIIGMDLNYSSDFVIKGDITDTKLESDSYDLVLCLDVIEHLNFSDQEKALKEIQRILNPDGTLLATIPNLAHFASRLSFLLTGRLFRTSKIERHIGDRPIDEYIELINKHFTIVQRKGIFPTFPISAFLTYKFPSKVLLLHRVLNRAFARPNWCFLNIFICSKK